VKEDTEKGDSVPVYGMEMANLAFILRKISDLI